MGLELETIFFPFVKKGHALAIFRQSGNISERKELLITRDKGSAKYKIDDLTMLTGMTSQTELQLLLQ